ncbi:MAG: nucleoside phosphorylase, partial [Candidatus Hermodarchaeota archaeon]
KANSLVYYMDFFDEDSRVYIEPSEEIEFYRAAYPLPSKLIYSPFSRPELPQKGRRRKIKELPKLYQGTHLYCIDDRIVYFQGFLGAPATVIFLEQLIALGIREIIFLGLAGAIQSATIGDRIVVTEAMRFEGTSYHYLPTHALSVPSEEVTNDLERFLSSNRIPFIKGKICSTDAPFRETFNLIEQLRQKKVIAIEMEIAAALAVAIFRNVKAGALVIISDELKDHQWSRFQPEHFSKAFISSFNHLVEFFS